jgi:hypothetical protein
MPLRREMASRADDKGEPQSENPAADGWISEPLTVLRRKRKGGGMTHYDVIVSGFGGSVAALRAGDEVCTVRVLAT